MFILIFVLALLVSHHMAGPLFRLEHDLDKLLNGENVKFHFRKGDKLERLAIKLNECLALSKKK